MFTNTNWSNVKAPKLIARMTSMYGQCSQQKEGGTQGWGSFKDDNCHYETSYIWSLYQWRIQHDLWSPGKKNTSAPFYGFHLSSSKPSDNSLEIHKSHFFVSFKARSDILFFWWPYSHAYHPNLFANFSLHMQIRSHFSWHRSIIDGVYVEIQESFSMWLLFFFICTASAVYHYLYHPTGVVMTRTEYIVCDLYVIDWESPPVILKDSCMHNALTCIGRVEESII